MGVMACSKRGCPHVMCDTYIDSVGYICWECQRDFETWLNKNEANPKTEEQINRHLVTFMNIEHSDYNDENEISVGEFFRKYTAL